MAERADVAPTTVQRIEKGAPVRADSWRAVAQAFGIDADVLLAASTRNDGPARVAQALGVENVGHTPSGRVVPHPTIGWGADKDGTVRVSVLNPHLGNRARSVELTPDEQALANALGWVNKIENREMASAALGPLIGLLTASLSERNEY
jgi:hypothetical protein